MARASKSSVASFEKKVISVVKDLYESGLISITINNDDIDHIMRKMNTDKVPRFLRKEKAGRGQYDISKYVNKEPSKNVVVKKTKTASVEPTNQATVVEAVAQVVPMKKPAPVEVPFDPASLIPKKDPNFVKFGDYKDLKAIVSSGMFVPTYIVGPTGNGKTFTVEQIHAELKKPLIRVNMNRMVDEDQLIGTKTLEDGNIKIVEGPVLIAMRLGITILIDEIDAAEANTIMCLQSILEGMKAGKPYYFKLKNEVIYPKPGFNIIATANTKGQGSDTGEYIGTNVLNKAFLERFVGTFKQSYPPEKIERDILTNYMNEFDCFDENILNSLIKWCIAIRLTYADGGCNDLVTTRRMGHIVKAYSIFRDINKAVQFCVNGFDDATTHAFINLFDKVHNDSPIPVVEPISPEPVSNTVPDYL